MNITEFQHTAHTDLVKANRVERDHKAGEHGAFGRKLKAWPTLAKNLAPWQRDGFKTESHYLMRHRPATMRVALEDPTHPQHAKANECHKLGLI